MSTVEKQTYTATQLLAMEDEKGYELVNGELVERHVSGESSHIAVLLIGLLTPFVSKGKLGYLFGADCGFQCFGLTTGDADRVRKPDVSFVATGRITQVDYQAGYVPVVPDLAVEVVSPNDKARELDEKLEEYLQAGVKLVWIVHPKTKTVDVHRPDGSDSRLRADDKLTGEDVIPGFECQVADLFPEVP
ncbi:MAG: Uma2 family endonuclease [Planctomycetaceae bacterium]